MIITCPHCQTRYQVTYEAIGAVGRQVQCAHCHQAWRQHPAGDDVLFPEQQQALAAMAEDALDEMMQAEERNAALAAPRRAVEPEAEDIRQQAVAARAEAALLRQRQIAFSQRQSAMAAEFPLARLRRSLRVVAVLLLAAVLALFYFGRTPLVLRFPALAGIYAGVGLQVNVVGLDFSNVTTLRSLHEGREILMVSAQIVGLLPEPAVVPPVVVTLLDAEGRGLYEWSVTPGVRDLMAGERATFDTRLTQPPAEAVRLRLSFADGQAVAPGAVQDLNSEQH